MITMKLLEMPEDAFEPAAKMFDRSLKTLEEDVDNLEEWLRTQPHLPEIMDRHMIKNLLICNKFRIEQTKKTLDFYYTIRSKLPDVFDSCNPKRKNIQKALDSIYILPMPKPTADNGRLWILLCKDFSNLNSEDIFNFITVKNNIQEIRLREDCLLGDYGIWDLKYMDMSFLLKVTPSILMSAVTIYQCVYKMRLKAIHLINSPPVVGYALNMVKKFVKPKIFDRVHVHYDDSVVLKLFPKSMIPKDYGGEERSLEELRELWKVKFEEYSDMFDKLETLRVDEKLRPEPLVDDDRLGFYGNFKKLNVD